MLENHVYLESVDLYGSSRLGMRKTFVDIEATLPVIEQELVGVISVVRGLKNYELSNHLGNVLSVISDRKKPICDQGSFSYFEADIITATDYSPFGAPLAGRTFSSNSYRYGMNGMEKDDEVKGAGNQLDFGARIYDPRLGRWLSIDPLQAKYAGYSPYNFALNSPVFFYDKDGRDVGAGITIKNNSSQPIIFRGDGEQIKTMVDGTQKRVNGDNRGFDPKDLARDKRVAGDDAIRDGFTLNPGDSYSPSEFTTTDKEGNKTTTYGGLITRADGSFELTPVHDPDFVDLEEGQKIDIDRWDGKETVSPETNAERHGNYLGSGVSKGEIQLYSGGDKTDVPAANIEIKDSKEKGKLELKVVSGDVDYNTDDK